MPTETIIEDIKPKQKFNLLKVIICIGLILIVLSIAVYFIGNAITSTPEKDMALHNVQKLKDMLKDPDSFKLYDDILVIYQDINENNSVSYIYIDYGAKNSFGGMIRKTAMFKEYNYVGNYGDADGYDVNAENIDRSLDFLNAGLTYLSYQVGTDSAKDYKIIAKNAIMKKLK